MPPFLTSWKTWLFAVVAGYFYFVEIAPNWTTFRYRMTVVIETPEGEKTGSSVVEYVRRPGFNIHGTYRMLVHFSTREGTLFRAQHWTRGLATIIDVGPAGWVVVPRLFPYGAYKIQPAQLHAQLRRVAVEYSDGSAVLWIPRQGELAATWYGLAGKLPDVAEGVSIKSMHIEPTSNTLIARVGAGGPRWVEALRVQKKVMASQGPVGGRFGFHISMIEKGWW